MILVGKPTGRYTQSTVIIIGRKRRSKFWQVACFGQKGHYDATGRCAHTDEVMASLRPEIDRALVRVLPFGDRGRKTIPAEAA